ncbi:hypothetical protein fugu_010269 [Takifugu bimaculatus]|uniref:Uncharacterized protein n=1 Tax=Takifugu bimaculatus TaxID=433685 RepID=A0A4Z2CEW0_9TELE|nr:hypothetical protein fugu_010269 [Takifugu bimaculatus]
MERCFISPVARLTAPCCLISLLLIALATQPSTCNHDDSEDEEQVDAQSIHLSVTAQVTPTPQWAVVWVDPQFYVTVTISSLLILAAVVITAKLCYDRSCSQHPAPLSRGAAPPLSLALPRSLASEDSRQTLRSTSSSFTDRER